MANFTGSLVALVTPMTGIGLIDENKLRTLVEKHIEAKTSGLVINGTTGEGAALSSNERESMIKIVVETAANRIPVIAGTGTSSTIETIARTERALELGVDACLVVTPYYNRPTQEGMYQHFKAVAETVPVPIIMYNVPKRTGVDLMPDTIERLSHISNIIGLKEATGDLARQREINTACQNKFSLYSGDDPSALAFMCQGGRGVISITANVAPKAMSEMCRAALSGQVQLAGELNTALMPLHKAMCVESNPIPVKWALQKLGWIQAGIRLPLTSLSDQYHEEVTEALKIAKVI